MIGDRLHEQSYAIIAETPQAVLCDISSCDYRRSAVHRGMTPEEIRAGIKALGLNVSSFARLIGMDKNYLGKSLGRQRRRITASEMDAIRAALRRPDENSTLGRTIPWPGKVPAGRLSPAEYEGGRRFAVYDPETPPNAYALSVEGDSMDLIVPNGATIVIDPDDNDLWPGRRYVIQTEDGETTFKEFQADPARLVPCSSNPEHEEIPLVGRPFKVLGRVFSYTMRDVPRRRT